MIEGTGVTSSVSILTRTRRSGRRQEMIDDVEALLARRPVDGGDVDEGRSAARIVAQERHDLDDLRGTRAITVSSP